MAIAKRKLIKWLSDNGFEKKPGGKSSHAHYRHSGTGVVITLSTIGRPELSKKHEGMIIRELERAGFDRSTIRSDLAN